MKLCNKKRLESLLRPEKTTSAFQRLSAPSQRAISRPGQGIRSSIWSLYGHASRASSNPPAQQETTSSSNLLPERPHLPLSHYWFAALTTSLTVMRPPAPEPSISERFTPSCSAFCLAASVASGSSSSLVSAWDSYSYCSELSSVTSSTVSPKSGSFRSRRLPSGPSCRWRSFPPSSVTVRTVFPSSLVYSSSEESSVTLPTMSSSTSSPDSSRVVSTMSPDSSTVRLTVWPASLVVSLSTWVPGKTPSAASVASSTVSVACPTASPTWSVTCPTSPCACPVASPATSCA